MLNQSMIISSKTSILKFIDFVTILVGWGGAYLIRFHLLSEAVPDSVSVKIYILFGVLFSMVWYFCMEVFGVYDKQPSFVFNPYNVAVWPILRAGAFAFLISVMALHFLARDDVSRVLLLLFFGITVQLLILQRFLIKSLYKKNQKPKTVLVIGEKNIGLKIKECLGIESINLAKIISTEEFLNLQCDNKFQPFIEKLNISDVIICLDGDKVHFLNNILEETSEENLYIHIIPNIFYFALLGLKVGTIGSFPVLSVNQHIIQGFNSYLKRFLDIITCCIALIIFLPIILLFIILIKFTSKGPVIYSQDRIGMDGKKFKMYKFRSMKLGAEKHTGPVWASQDDTRTTTVGRIMRKTSLDELPQLINVLKGEMSIVGPRPERPVFVEKFKSEIPGYMQRHKIKSGITGWAQINGYRGNTDLKERIKHDLFYINNWSIIFDIKIMILTFTKGFISKDAY